MRWSTTCKLAPPPNEKSNEEPDKNPHEIPDGEVLSQRNERQHAFVAPRTALPSES